MVAKKYNRMSPTCVDTRSKAVTLEMLRNMQLRRKLQLTVVSGFNANTTTPMKAYSNPVSNPVPKVTQKSIQLKRMVGIVTSISCSPF